MNADSPVAQGEIVADDGGAVLSLHDKRYRSDSYDGLRALLRQADAAAPSGRVIVDLSRVLLFSSSALRALRAAHVELEARGGAIVAAGGGDLVSGVLKFAPFILHYPTVEEALSAHAGSSGMKEDDNDESD